MKHFEMFSPVSSKSELSPIDIMELARVYDILTVEDCYKRDSLMAYLYIVEDLLKSSNPGG